MLMPNRLLIDTNLLVLLVVGVANETYIAKHGALSIFDRDDYLILKNLISVSAGVVVTPHILAETSNLLRQIKDPMRTELTRRLGQLIQNNFKEVEIGAPLVVARDEFLWLGLTDAGILAADTDQMTILTTDAGLHLSALKAGRESLNYNHVREQRRDYRQ